MKIYKTTQDIQNHMKICVA